MELRVCHTCRAVRPGATLCPGCSGALTLADVSHFLGQTFGKYRLDALLGAGGMGVVYRATHVGLERSVALKLVVPQRQDASFERRFAREARVLAELRHPHIVEIYDFDVSPWGLPYYVMEHLQGLTLRELLEAGAGRLSMGALRELLDGVGAALSYAHRKGVVHRDLKPDNVFVARFDGRATVKLLDFGIAKLMAGERDATTSLTAAGAIVGTPHYLAPEQILDGTVDARTDQYALALIVAEALAGRALRAGKTLMQILATELERPADLSTLPADASASLRAALTRATQPAQDARFPDVAAFVAALELPAADPAELARLVAERSEAPRGSDGPTLDATRASSAQRPRPADAPARDQGPTALLTPSVPSLDSTAAAAPLPEAPIAPGRAPLARRRLVLALLAALGLAAGVFVLRQQRDAAPATPQATTSARAAGLRPRGSLALPPDVTRLLALDEGTLVTAGADALYLHVLADGQPPTRVALAAGQAVLGPAEGAGLWLRDGTRLLRVEARTQQKSVWLERLPAGDGELLVSPSGRHVARLEPQRISVCEVVRTVCQARFSAPRAAGVALQARLGDAYLAVAQGGRALDVYAAGDGRRVYTAALRETQIHDLALLEDAHLLALGGWFPYAEIHDLRSTAAPVRIARQGPATRLAWIPDEPTLLVSGPRGAQAWSATKGLVDLDDGRARHSEARADDLLVAAGARLLLLGDEKRVVLFDHDGLTFAQRVALGPGLVWALQADPATGNVFAGTSAGTLYAWDAAQRRLESFELHADGVTDLALQGDVLASSSDDKTLAVWRLPRPSVTWRSRAHDYLVNQLALAGQPPSLWTSSSDGRAKRWGWPQPDEQEQIDARRVMPGEQWALHALWVSPDQNHVLAGTWQHALLDLRRGPQGSWSGRRWPVDAQVVYRALPLPALDVVLFVGLYPARVYAHDLRSGRLALLPSFGQPVYTLAAGDAPDEAFVLGAGCALRYRLRRAATGALAGEIRVRQSTSLGVPLSAARVASHTLVAGTDGGELLWLDTRALDVAPLARWP